MKGPAHSFLLFAAAFLSFGSARAASPLPLSSAYRMESDGKSIPVYAAEAAHGKKAPFSILEWNSPCQVAVNCAVTPSSASILPASLKIPCRISGKRILFQLDRPANLTVEINGNPGSAFHLFASEPGPALPSPDDPNVLYFGPGLHRVATLRPKSNQSIYLAPGAVLQAVLPPEEKALSFRENKGRREAIHANFIEGQNLRHVRIFGSGILDLSRLPGHSRKAIWFEDSQDISISGITILDSPDWAIAFQNCRQVVVRNVKQISPRENSDGIDISNSQKVLVSDCFFRCNDDAVSVKTLAPPPAMPSEDILVKNCVVWNERARGLGITSETRADIRYVVFENCDIIHDLSAGGDCAALAILVSDSGTVENIVFRNIQISDCRSSAIRCWIGSDAWGRDFQRGRIRAVRFEDIAIQDAASVKIELLGHDKNHQVEKIIFRNVSVNGSTDLTPETNPFVSDLKIRGCQILP